MELVLCMILRSHHLHVFDRSSSKSMSPWLESLLQTEESFAASAVTGTSNSNLLLSVVRTSIFVELNRNKLFTSETQSTSRKVLSSTI